MKKKLLVLLGAGSSVEQDFPSTGQLDDEVAKLAADFVKNKAPDPIDSFDARTRTDDYDLLWKNREGYCADLNLELGAIA